MSKTMTPSKRAMVRYQLRLGVLMAIYIVALFIGVSLKAAGELKGWMLFAAAWVPGFSVAGVFWAIGRLIVEMEDEFLRMLMVRQTLIATGFSLGLAAIHGFMSTFDLAARIDAYWWPVLFFAGLGIGMVSNRISYGSWGQCQ